MFNNSGTQAMLCRFQFEQLLESQQRLKARLCSYKIRSCVFSYYRAEFDQGTVESLKDEKYDCDMHTITAVLKMYFRELPNPLLTYQLYDSFSVSF